MSEGGAVIRKTFVSALFGALSFFYNANFVQADTVVYGASIGALGENLVSTFDLAGHFLGSVTLTGSNPVPPGGQSPWPYPTQITFAPNGTLYGASIDPFGRNILSTFDQLGHVTSSVFLTQSNPMLGQQPWPYSTQIAFAPDGTLFGMSNAPQGDLLTTFDLAGHLLSAVLLTESDPMLGQQPWPYSTQIAFAPDVAETATPLPTSLPLFASGLGALGLLGWRRKKSCALPIS
jgi:hypothetical protein